MILVYTLIFSTVMKARLPGSDDSWAYSIYLCAGILTWTYFSDTVLRCQTLFIEQANLLKKVNFPRLTLPIIVLLSSTINFIIIFFILILFLLAIGRFPGISILLVLPVLALQQGFAIGLGMLTGTLNVFSRDVGKFIGIVMTFWFWMTPIIYPIEILPPVLQDALKWNPMFESMNFYHALLLGNEIPPASSLYYLAFFSLTSLLLGYFCFHKLVADMVDEL